ncbi:MAG: hypothetical protein KC505_05350 [Myxococcales bacterium]|nr:hypothetical protein [Myxococcales bacterium]USN51506.1 MAG: hypothetical protein H6731_03625 [Myxococcales bacterium]
MARITGPIVCLCIMLSANTVMAFDQAFFQVCKSTFYSCVESITQNDTTFGYANCTQPFDQCLEKLLDIKIPWPLECFQAEASWTNFYISIGAFFSILAFNNIVVPAALKAVAWAVTKCMKADIETHPKINSFGNFLGIFFDENRNGEVTASEINTPQSFVTFAGLSFPVYYLFQALSQQAGCDFARAVIKCATPGFDDDDFCDYYH